MIKVIQTAQKMRIRRDVQREAERVSTGLHGCQHALIARLQQVITLKYLDVVRQTYAPPPPESAVMRADSPVINDAPNRLLMRGEGRMAEKKSAVRAL